MPIPPPSSPRSAWRSTPSSWRVAPRESARSRRRTSTVGFMTTALAPDELLVEVRIPAGAGTLRTAFVEIARRHGDFALVGVAAAIALDGDGLITDARLVFTGVGFDAGTRP